MHRWRGRLAGGAIGALLVLAVLVFGYGSAAVVGGLVPVNRGWAPPANGVRIHVIDNGVHTSLVLPVRAAGVDWNRLARPADFPSPRAGQRSHVSFGWGDRGFYRRTERFWQVSPRVGLRALAGLGPSVLHVTRRDAPTPGPRVRSLLLSPDAYRRLAGVVAATFAGGAPERAYGTHDAFYPAHGRYSPHVTCNEWTGRALRAAGVRMGAWTPFSFSVMQWL